MFRRILSYLRYYWWWLCQPYETRRYATMYMRIIKALLPNTKGRDMEEDMRQSPIIRAKVKNKDYAVNLYRIMCNNEFTYPTKKKEPWACTWRYAGGLVAELRNQGEDYMDFYCSGNESYVDEEVEQDLKDLGWTVIHD